MESLYYIFWRKVVPVAAGGVIVAVLLPLCTPLKPCFAGIYILAKIP